MIYNEPCNGKYITIRSVKFEDAEFTSALRSDKKKCEHIHNVDATIEGQIKWINYQQNKANDYYFLIQSLTGDKLGTIALYNFFDDECELGRWVSYGNALQNLESVVLLHDIAFDSFNMNAVFTCTNITNAKVISFWKHFGSDKNYVEEQLDFIANKNVVYKDTYKKLIRPKLAKLLRYEE